ncbi:DUF1028 domain-containing protein [Pseudooceanicola lipolyticus]|uniref:DUF1028 domain-containing protein n=1 Tax=Pseudooceanicola lipolyticus TaxID=2029104 RepID=A0A2M8J7I2_9RHOB|nr:DUF1028 domain-containing protein [Pseudooceanicola lipolyticus]PJE38735.1 DUF1028 domain-containing protein [Pseudooceanicola lipolyticus]
MTFSIIGRCVRTGAFGAAITTSDLAVGGRCVRLLHGKGAVLSQHRTDSRLGDLGISLLAEGKNAQDTVTEVCNSTKDIEWRQIGALDAKGRASAYHGRRMYSIYTHSIETDCLALGNILANETVTRHMAEAFARDPNLPLGERLMQALEAGRDAGGEIVGPLKSAAVRVTGEHGIDAMDLRIDMSEGTAVEDLRALVDAYAGRAEILRDVALAPEGIPVMRSLFEASIARIEELGLQARFPTAQHRDSWTLRD